jgi:hypothetical protein
MIKLLKLYNFKIYNYGVFKLLIIVFLKNLIINYDKLIIKIGGESYTDKEKRAHFAAQYMGRM